MNDWLAETIAARPSLAAFGRDARQAAALPNVHFDTMGDDPLLLKVRVDYFRAQRVLVGTDFPILPSLQKAGLKACFAEAARQGSASAS